VHHEGQRHEDQRHHHARIGIGHLPAQPGLDRRAQPAIGGEERGQRKAGYGGARLIASRSGGLRLWPLQALGSTASPVASLDPSTAVSMAAVPMAGPLTPPAAFWSVGYARTHSTTTTPKPTVSATERERLAKPYRTAVWSDATNLTRYAQASRPDMVATALLQQADAQSLANSLGALWGVQRSLWQVTLPTASALLREIGDVVTLQWPADGLRTGALGQVVGDSLRAGDPTASLLVLV